MNGKVILIIALTSIAFSGCAPPLGSEPPFGIPTATAFALNATAVVESSQTIPATEPAQSERAVQPALRTDLSRDCADGEQPAPPPRQGEAAIDFHLNSTNGEGFHLAGLLAQKPVVLIFGSFT